MRVQRTRIPGLAGCLIVLFVGLPGYAQEGPLSSPAQREVWKTVEAYSAASHARDLDRYLSYWHPDFIGWHNGDEAPTDKAARTKGLTWYFANTTPEEFALEPMAIQVLGDVAVVHYKIRQTLRQRDGEAAASVSHWTDVLVNEEGRWLLISDHGGEIAQESDAAPPPALRLAGLKIKVPDMDEALAFYRDVLGFEVLSDARYPASVALKSDDLPLTLERATDPAETSAPQTARAKLSLESYDLLATMERLKGLGVTFLVDPPEPYGYNEEGVPLGLSTWLRDPFGNAYSIDEQQVRRGEAFTGIRVYNTGFSVPDVEAARAFYCGKLGFVALTETYYPNIPLGYADGSFAFMLHERETAGDVAPPGQLVLVFETDDLAASVKALQDDGVAFLYDTPRQTADGRFLAFKDSFGTVSELLERRVTGSP